MLTGNKFHAVGLACENARSPNLVLTPKHSKQPATSKPASPTTLPQYHSAKLVQYDVGKNEHWFNSFIHKSSSHVHIIITWISFKKWCRILAVFHSSANPIENHYNRIQTRFFIESSNQMWLLSYLPRSKSSSRSVWCALIKWNSDKTNVNS